MIVILVTAAAQARVQKVVKSFLLSSSFSLASSSFAPGLFPSYVRPLFSLLSRKEHVSLSGLRKRDQSVQNEVPKDLPRGQEAGKEEDYFRAKTKLGKH